MNKLFLALMFGTILLPTESFADDRRGRDSYGWSSRYEQREVQSSDPGYYCHRHERKIHKDDVRRHCHSAYSDGTVCMRIDAVRRRGGAAGNSM